MEKGRQLGSEVIAAVKLDKLGKAVDYIQARFADYRNKATPEQHATLLEVATHAANLERQTKTKIEAVLNPEKRYLGFLPGASKNEASAEHAGVSQDEVLCDDDHQLYGVFDGMGGYDSGDKASKDAARVVKATLDRLLGNPSKTDIALVLTAAFKQAGQAIYDADYNQGVNNDYKGRTVGVVAKIHTAVDGKRTAVIVHGGDARAYVRKKDGQLIQLTQDHGLLSHYVKLRQITTDQARKLNEKFSNVINPQTELNDVQIVVGGYTELGLYENGNIVTSSVDKDDEPEITEYELEGGDQLLFTSDGIHDLVPDAHIARAFDGSSGSDETVGRLLNKSKSNIRVGPGNKTDDDRSALVVGMEDVLASEIERVKDAYLEAARANKYLPVPLDVVAREAVVLALRADSDLIEGRVHRQFRDQMPSSVEAAGWRAVGLNAAMDVALAGAEPIDPVQAIQSERLSMNYSHFSRRVLQERQIVALLGTGFVPRDANEAIRQLDYLDTGAITVEQGLVDTLTELVKLLTSDQLDIPALENSMQVEQIASKLGLSKKAVIETVQAQHAALLHQAAQQEKAGRSIKKALAKGAGYVAAGVGLSMAGLAPAGVMALVAGAKVYDAFTSVGKQDKTRKAIEAQLLGDLTTSRDAYAALADADREANKATGLYKTVLENLAAGLAQRKEEQLRGAYLDATQVAYNYYNQLLNNNLSTEWDAKDAAEREYEAAVHARAPADEQARLHTVLLETQAIFNQLAEPYRRMAEAQGSLAAIDDATVELEANVKKSVTPGWLERYPRIAAMLGMRAETVSEKLASVAFFTAMGVAAREHIGVRIAVSVFAGIRLGDTLFTLVDRALTGEASLLTVTALEDIDPSDGPTAKAQLDKLTGTAAKTREKLLDQDFKRRKPKEYRELQTTLHVYEQLTLTTNAQLAIYSMDNREYNHWQLEVGKKNTEKIFRTFSRLGMVGIGAVVGGLIGEHLATLAAVRAEQDLKNLPPDATPGVTSRSWSELLAGAKSSMSGFMDKVIGTKIEDTASDATINTADIVPLSEVNANIKGLLSFDLPYDQYDKSVQHIIKPHYGIGGLERDLGIPAHGLEFSYDVSGADPNNPHIDLWVKDPASTYQQVTPEFYQELQKSLHNAPDNAVVSNDYLESYRQTGHLPVYPEATTPVGQPAPEGMTGVNEPVVSGTTPAAGVPPADAPPVAAADTPPVVPTGSTAAGAAPNEPTPPVTPSGAGIGTAEQLSHKVAKTEGLWHGLRGQGSNAEIAAGLNKTEVVIDGKTVSMMETGVRDADTVSPDLGADGKVHLYDVHDGHQIADSEMGKYLYIMKEGPSGHDVAPTPEPVDVGNARIESAPVGAPEGYVAFRAPDLGSDASQSDYVTAGLVDYVQHDRDYAYLIPLDPTELANRPELTDAVSHLTKRYQAAVLHPAIEPAAPLGRGGGLPEPAPAGAADNTFSSLESGADYTNARGELNAAGMKASNLQEHFTVSGEMQDYGHFKSDMFDLIRDKRDGDIRTPNHLIFENRSGELCVDVAGGPKEHHPVTPELYTALMDSFKNVIDQPGHSNRFDQDDFKAVLAKAK